MCWNLAVDEVEAEMMTGSIKDGENTKAMQRFIYHFLDNLKVEVGGSHSMSSGPCSGSFSTSNAQYNLTSSGC